MFRSSTINKELALNLAKVIFILKDSVKLRRYLLYGCVAACHGMASVLHAVQNTTESHSLYRKPLRFLKHLTQCETILAQICFAESMCDMVRKICKKAFKKIVWGSPWKWRIWERDFLLICACFVFFFFWEMTSFVSRRGMWRKRWASRRNPRRRCWRHHEEVSAERKMRNFVALMWILFISGNLPSTCVPLQFQYNSPKESSRSCEFTSVRMLSCSPVTWNNWAC